MQQINNITNNIILELKKTIQSVIQPLMPAIGEKLALLDFPNHPNVGDSAIWLGEYLFLQDSNYQDNLYLSEIDMYSRDELSTYIGNGTILLHGGGNLGDLWPKHQLFREAIIRDFPDNRIIQLPQSVCFCDDSNARRARAVFERHQNLTILVRDKESFEVVTDKLNSNALLCPDMAFYLGPMKSTLDAIIQCVSLIREDKEAQNTISRPARDGVWKYDWMTDELTPVLQSSIILRYQYYVEKDPAKRNIIRKKFSSLFPQLAKERIIRGCNGLAKGHGVITERLHGHILCLLMDTPHCILDTPYGKTRNFVNAWGYDSPLVNWNDSYDDALEMALSF